MSAPFVLTSRNLFAAITANDSARVYRILDDVQLDPNVDMHEQDVPIFGYGADHHFSSKVVFRQVSSDTGPTALHVAIVLFFHRLNEKERGPVALSLDIIQQLLEFGADSSFGISNMSYVFRGVSYRCETATTPIELAARLNQLISVANNHLPASESIMIWSNRLIELLLAAQRTSGGQPSSLSVLHSATETNEKMLFSERFSDVKFVCGDEVIVHAHKNVLAASSQYFDAAFDGPWKESESGEWMTSHKSDVIKVVLTLLYTGKINSKLVDEDPLAFVSVALEYNLDSLKSLAESSCVRLVNGSNVNYLLQSAHLYGCSVLMNACAEYVKKNPLAVLQNAEIMNLKTENPDVWDELWKAIEAIELS